MFEKCPTCRNRIVAGGRRFVKWTFCNEKCESRFKLALAEQLVSPEELNQRVHRIFEAECPSCHRFARNSLIGTTTVTGLLVAFRVKNRKHICCAVCPHEAAGGGRTLSGVRLVESESASLPMSSSCRRICLACCSSASRRGLRWRCVKFVKTRVAEELAPQLHAAAQAQQRAIEEEESRDEEAERI